MGSGGRHRRRLDNKMEYFLFLKSNDCLGYFPSNKPMHFTIRLAETLDLEHGEWFCALRDIKTYWHTNADLYVYCDVIKESHIFGTKLPILRHITHEQYGRIIQTYDSSINFKITRPELSFITIDIKAGMEAPPTPPEETYIKEGQNPVPLFPDEPTTCTLHLFKK